MRNVKKLAQIFNKCLAKIPPAQKLEKEFFQFLYVTASTTKKHDTRHGKPRVVFPLNRRS